MPAGASPQRSSGHDYSSINFWLRGVEPTATPPEATDHFRDQVCSNVSKRRLDPPDGSRGQRKRRALSPPDTEPDRIEMDGSLDGFRDIRTIHPAGEGGNDVTPRPVRFLHQALGAASPSHTSSSRTSSRQSKRSASSTLPRNPSPTKQQRSAELDENGYTLASFFTANQPLPRGLQTLVNRLQDIRDGAVGFPHAWWNGVRVPSRGPFAYHHSLTLEQ
jgi:hypothetical protein